MRPGRKMLVLLSIWCFIAMAAAFCYLAQVKAWGSGFGLAHGVLVTLWWMDAVVRIVLLFWGRVSLGRVSFELLRKLPNPLPVGVWSKVSLKIYYEGPAALTVSIFDHHPDTVEAEGLPLDIKFSEGKSMAEVKYRIKPTERGTLSFDSCQILIRGRLGLLDRSLSLKVIDKSKVYPNFQAVAGYAMLAAENRVSQMGILKKRRRGEGLDFHQLRRYRVGDSMRQIDWKATSRLKKMISREYQEERDQQVVFLLDCGRRMMAKDGDISHFDHTLNSLLLMTYVALRQGDSVGLLTFSGEKRWMSPRKGQHRFNEMMNLVYDLKPSSQGSDYSSAASELMARLKKRALVVVLSNLRDEDSGDVIPAIKLLKKNHLVLFASLQETELNRTLEKDFKTFEETLTIAATHRYLASRRRAHEELSRRKVVTLDVEPQELPIALVNRYLEIKSSQML
jgi:uncharacterized protein (DUF58 family)